MCDLTILELVHLFHFFAHPLELIGNWSLTAEGVVATNTTAALENADIALSRLQSLIVLNHANVMTSKLVLMALKLVTKVLSEILNLGQEWDDHIILVF